MSSSEVNALAETCPPRLPGIVPLRAASGK
jgi:hypothetical protein